MLLTVPALAATDSTSNFTRSKTYSGEFSDLSERSVFYDNVVALYEYGLSVGKADGTFGLQDSMTVGQIIIFAGPASAVSTAPASAEAGPSGLRHGGTGRLRALSCAICRPREFSAVELDGTYFSAATRAQVAHVLANTLPDDGPARRQRHPGDPGLCLPEVHPRCHGVHPLLPGHSDPLPHRHFHRQ